MTENDLRSDSVASPPDFLLVNLLELLLVILAVSLSVVEFQRATGLGSVLDRLVEGLKHWRVSCLELQTMMSVRSNECARELGILLVPNQERLGEL